MWGDGGGAPTNATYQLFPLFISFTHCNSLLLLFLCSTIFPKSTEIRDISSIPFAAELYFFPFDSYFKWFYVFDYATDVLDKEKTLKATSEGGERFHMGNNSSIAMFHNKAMLELYL